MSEPRLKSKMLVQAGLRHCMALGLMATVVRSGDEDAGAVYLKINRLGPGFTILALARELDGGLKMAFPDRRQAGAGSLRRCGSGERTPGRSGHLGS